MSKQSIGTKSAQIFMLPVIFFTTAVLLFSFGMGTAMAQNCKHVRGYFINQVVVPTDTDDCHSPIGFCVSGQAIGVLKGNFLSTVTSFTPVTDILPSLVGTPVETVVFVTADLVIHTENGDLYLTETAASNQNPSQGDLGDVVTVMGGTEHWTDATGRLRVWGNLSPTVSDVSYEGQVCRP